MRVHLTFPLSVVSLFVLIFASPPGAAATVQELSDGPPALASGPLNKDSYAPLQVKKLKNARICWANFAYLREQGISIPEQGLTPALEKSLLDAFGYAVPNPWESKNDYADESRTLYADRYGGSGIGSNFGSGRAASLGHFQVKGIGQTPLVVDSGDRYHVSGGASVAEGIREAIWGEVLNHELPFGANRIVAIVCTGTDTSMDMQSRVPRALIVREDPVRPAHFIRNSNATGKLLGKAAENRRVRKLVEDLDRALPLPERLAANASKEERVRAGVIEFIQRLAKVWAYGYAHGFYHGATSPSNVGIEGKALDYGSQTAVAGFPRARNLDWDDAFGETRVLIQNVVQDFVGDLKTTLPRRLSKQLPSTEDAEQIFKDEYSLSLDREMISLTGVPYPVIDRLSANASYRSLAAILERMARDGNERLIEAQNAMPIGTGTYPLNRILTLLSQPQLNQNALAKFIPSQAVRKELLTAYQDFMDEALKTAGMYGLSEEAANRFIRFSARQRNARMYDLVRGDKYWRRIFSAQNDFIEKKDPSIIQNFVDEMIYSNRREYRDLDPFSVMIHETVDPVTGVHEREVFDARQNKILRTSVTESGENCELDLAAGRQ